MSQCCNSMVFHALLGIGSVRPWYSVISVGQSPTDTGLPTSFDLYTPFVYLWRITLRTRTGYWWKSPVKCARSICSAWANARNQICLATFNKFSSCSSTNFQPIPKAFEISQEMAGKSVWKQVCLLFTQSHSTFSSQFNLGTARYEVSLTELDSDELIKQDEIAVAESPSIPPPDTSTGNLRGSRSAGHHLPEAQVRREMPSKDVLSP